LISIIIKKRNQFWVALYQILLITTNHHTSNHHQSPTITANQRIRETSWQQNDKDGGNNGSDYHN